MNEELPNNVKIRFVNAFHFMQEHIEDCEECVTYINHGDGDLCKIGKQIIMNEMKHVIPIAAVD